MKSTLLSGLLFMLAFGVLGCSQMKKGAETVPASDNEIVRVLKSAPLGKDFPAALSALPAWGEAGETQMIIFPDRIVSGRSFRSAREAEPALKQLHETAARERPPTTQRAALLPEIPPEPGKVFKFELMEHFPDDGTTRLEAVGRDRALDLFSPKLEVAAVEARLGPPQKTETRVITDESDAQPTVLTYRHYAGGAISFVTVDPAPRPGRVGRVVMDVKRVREAVYGK